MGARVTLENRGLTVETDEPGKDAVHSIVHDDTGLASLMQTYGIKQVETADCSSYGLRRAVKEEVERCHPGAHYSLL
jgi:hypothetical protein